MKPALFLVLATVLPAWSQSSTSPPAIRASGILSAASHMPATLAGGRVAPGSLIEINGWRFGPDAIVEFTQGQTTVKVTPASVTENELVALLPSTIHPGEVSVTVTRAGRPSLPQPFQVTEASFGIFTQHGHGYGPGRITYDGAAARPRQLVRLFGTGLGVSPALARISVGGKRANKVRIVNRDAGTDQLEFEVPADAPLGCNVPVQVFVGKAAIPSNVVTIPISPRGELCADPHNWVRDILERDPRTGLIVLFRAATRLQLDPSVFTDLLTDGGYARFQERSPEEAEGRQIVLPPFGVCTAYTGKVSLRNIVSPTSMMKITGGKTLDAGPLLKVRGFGREEPIRPQDGTDLSYLSYVGGEGDLPQYRDHPPFFDPGEFVVSGAEGPNVGTFEAHVRARPSIVWKNRDRITTVDRSRGVTVEFERGEPDELVLVVASNADEDATAVSICLVPSGDNRFQVPAEAFANFPATASEEGLPVNLLLVASLPAQSQPTISMRGIDSAVAMFISASIRTVVYK